MKIVREVAIQCTVLLNFHQLRVMKPMCTCLVCACMLMIRRI